MPLSEADTRAKLIDPALHGKGWSEDLIRREVTAGAVQVVGGQLRQKSGRVDYVLRLPTGPGAQDVAVALIEAKAEKYSAAHGLQQGKAYAASSKRLNVSFVYSSNGHQFVEYDATSGVTVGPFPINEFPSPDALRQRYEEAKGFTLDSEAAKPLLRPYSGGESQRRYYQDAAIRAVLEKIAAGEKRALLSMATGSGKTRIAVQLLKKIADAGQLRRALFVCDRDELRKQATAQLGAAFGTDAAAATTNKPEKNARVVVATYQTLGVDTDDSDASFLKRHYPENYFSHIIIDEAHRSAWGKWSEVLTRNGDAVQIGLTATPRDFEYTEDTRDTQQDERITADNFAYFGEPVYEYSIGQGIEDGYLAFMEIQKRDVFLDHYVEPEAVTGIRQGDLEGKELRDARTGKEVNIAETRAEYKAANFEKNLMLPERVAAMCDDLFARLLATGGPEQKTIIFCARDSHADDVAIHMNNRYAQWRKDNGKAPGRDYAFKCTAAAGGELLPDFRDNGARHFVAATVDLLTTGVDVPRAANIVFFKYVGSPIAFYQMVGRGTRLHPESGKLMFRVYDYTNATRLFGEEFKEKFAKPPNKDGPGPDPDPARMIEAHGLDVRISGAGVYIMTTDGEGNAVPVSLEEYKQRLAAELVKDIPALDDFREVWIDPPRRVDLMGKLPDGGRAPHVVRDLTEMKAYDLYDVLADLGYGQAPRTRTGRAEAFQYKNARWLNGMPHPAAETVRAIASQFAKGGTENLETPRIFDTPEVLSAGGLDALKGYDEPRAALSETKRRMFTA